jgi:ribosomal protein S9
MGTIGVASILLLLVAVATTIVACVVIFSRRQQAQSAVDEVRHKAAEEKQRREVEQEAVRRAEEEERQRVEAERRRLEEELRRAEEERHKAEEECKRLAEEARREIEEVQKKVEAQRQTEELRKVEEEQRRREAAEAQREAEDETRRRAEEEARQRAKEDKERREIPLDHRPPRRQPGPQEPSEKRPPQEIKQRRPTPEIVCWKSERQWIPAVEVPEEFLENSGLAVLQNASPLTEDESREGCWRLEQVFGKVIVRSDEGQILKEIYLGEHGKNYLLFKLSGQDQNQGRRVKSPASGSYLVMVPDNWDRDDRLSGPPPVTPESVFLTGYQAHFFNVEKGGNEKIAFRTPEGKSVVIEPKAPRFELVGTRLNDASENIGPLFGERSPQIRALDDQAWKDVGTIVVGEEGSGKGRWRKSFHPTQEKIEQALPPEVADRKGGWYFLRFYDTNDELVESLDFRLVCALSKIRILQPSPFPFEDGHESTCVEFHHKPGCAIQPADDLACSIQIESKDNKTILAIPPEPTYDETQWRVGSEGKPQVQVTILVERFWWAVGQEDNLPFEWEDELLIITCDDFAATSKKALWLRLPKRRWADRILVGFERSRARPYTMKVAEKEIAIPLRDFGDCQEVRDRDQDHFLNIWIERDSELVKGVVAIIPASQWPILCVERGRKKTVIATAMLREGAGAIKVNGQPVADYFRKARARQFLWRLLELPHVSQVLSQMEVSIEVAGSSSSTVQQVKASAHALARALIKYDPRLKPLLKQAGFGGARVAKKSGVQ